MKNELSLNFDLQEITENDLREINGGYGYWEGHNQGSAAAASFYLVLLDTAANLLACYPKLW
ncbi:hypothetical protein [Larkinella knui]|uniref:Bacteriocin n=1 Tax=Larkinella knui TaxID=2025310 RepID=A0A3P1CCR6_9BACT|nr:hypothetical protein [Larkinella knui]RRB10614.1 hypothetical protein EHT87_25965 [Larkinella knui]